MSWQASKWALGQTVGSAPGKAVLMVLAHAAGVEDDACHLSHATIASRSELSERAVWAQMRALEKGGLIRRERRVDGFGHRTADLIVLNTQTAPDASRDDEPQTARRASRKPPKPHDVRVGLTAPHALPNRTSCEPYPHEVRSIEEVESKVGEKVVSPPTPSLDELFARWWKLYPLKRDKEAARKAFERVLKDGLATFEQLCAGAIAYAGERAGKDPRYTKYPARWLNAGSWADEPLPEFSEPTTTAGRGSELQHAMEVLSND